MSRVGGEQKVSQKQHAKSGPEAAWQKVGQKQPAKFKAEVAWQKVGQKQRAKFKPEPFLVHYLYL